MAVFTDAQWTAMEPLIEAVRPQTGRELSNLRRTVEAILWRMQNGIVTLKRAGERAGDDRE